MIPTDLIRAENSTARVLGHGAGHDQYPTKSHGPLIVYCTTREKSKSRGLPRRTELTKSREWDCLGCALLDESAFLGSRYGRVSGVMALLRQRGVPRISHDHNITHGCGIWMQSVNSYTGHCAVFRVALTLLF
jgi:hypothetical protein